MEKVKRENILACPPNKLESFNKYDWQIVLKYI